MGLKMGMNKFEKKDFVYPTYKLKESGTYS